MPEPVLLWAPSAWTPEGWREQVVLRADGDGRWAEVTPGIATPPPDAQVLGRPAAARAW
jgi:formimidoylglutamate deiminase